jgi:excisionase family DNA binding protein
MTTHTPNTRGENLPDLMTVREVSRYLKLSEEGVRDNCNAGRIPAVRLSGSRGALRIPRDGLLAAVFGPGGPDRSGA